MRLPLNTLATLENIKIASPCSVAWAGMEGDDQTRFCSKRQQKVYNLSIMTAEQASSLLREK